MTLEFNDQTHQYRLDGRLLPSITQVLHATGILSMEGIPADKLEFARMRGVALHCALDLRHRGTLDPETVSSFLEGYLWAYDDFVKATNFKPILFEQPLAHARLGFAGTPDAAGTVCDVPAVVEFKAVHTLRPGYAIQTAAQKLLIRETGTYDPIKRYALQLHRNGTYTLVEHTDSADEAEFRAALFCYQRRLIRNGGYY